MKHSIPYTTYRGVASELCRKGDAVEFIQPWYVPISTTPENTGMAVGGVGSTFTLTPLGHTPNFSFIPGIFIDCSEDDIHFNDFFCSVMSPLTLDNIELSDLGELAIFNKFYPALFESQPLDLTSDEAAISAIRSAAISGAFYAENKDNFARWNVELTAKTKRALQVDESAVETQLLVLVDFFNGLLVNGTAKSLALTAGQPERAEVEAISADNINYRALYPMAQYEYKAFDEVSIKRKVVSPVVKDDKELCSLPMHWNHFELSNPSSKTQIVTLVQPLENLIGSTYRKVRDGIQDSACRLVQNPISQRHERVELDLGEKAFIGVSQYSDCDYGADVEGEVMYGVQLDNHLINSGCVDISVKSKAYTTRIDKQVRAALSTGRTNDHFDHGIYTGREGLGSIVCVQVTLQPGDCIDIRFAQALEHSKISLNGWQSSKAYTQFFGEEKPARTIMQRWLPRLTEIETRICNEQQRFLGEAQANMDDSTATRFATMAMNSLSFLAESSVWDEQDKLLVKECVDYPFFNSLDVYFYGSFSLLYLLPELDGCVLSNFADAILASDDTRRRFWEYEDKPHAELVDAKYEGVRAVTGAVIHDLGSPFDIQPDAYTWHNVKEWKDLAPKFLLMVYRHYQHSGDVAVIDTCWDAIVASIAYLSELIEEGDTLPLTRGTDDTFDNLASHGISIYCGSLWSAGLKVAAEMAMLMDRPELAREWGTQSKAALDTIERSLWDERNGYYHFFVTPVSQKHLTGVGYEPLVELGLELSGNAVSDKQLLNRYLEEVDESSSVSKLEQRLAKKQQLKQLAPEAFTPEYDNLVADSDNSFGDALLADSYLKLMGLEGLFDAERIERTLDYIFQTNFLANSPKLGVANMVLADGAPHEAFQAQDVWIGVQFSVATSLRLAGKKAQAECLIKTVYNALYHLAKIPFAAPEGFNGSGVVESDELMSRFALTSAAANEWVSMLTQRECLLADGRVHPEITTDAAEFEALVKSHVDPDQAGALQSYLLSTGLKYTAGRYFRPGMIFSYVY